MTYRVGLSGGVGSGKSTVAALFRERGIGVIDTDAISHRLTQAGGAAMVRIRELFGPEYLTADGALDRPRMRALVFSNPDARLKLEGVLHPLVRTEMLAEAEAAESPYVILVVPLLFEAPGYRELVQRVLVVDCPEEAQVARTMMRSPLQESEVRAIMATQLSRPERLKLADDVIHNDAAAADLRPQVLRFHQYYLDRSSELAARPSQGPAECG